MWLSTLTYIFTTTNRIDFNFIIKVADFGLSETIDPSKDYFRQQFENDMKLPVKWLSPESLSDGVFSEKTDVVHIIVICSKFNTFYCIYNYL